MEDTLWYYCYNYHNLSTARYYRVFQKFVPIVTCILRKAFNASLGKCKLIQVRNLSK